MPRAVNAYSLDITVRQGRAKVREEFLKNAHLKDIRVIDVMVIKVHRKLLNSSTEYGIHCIGTHTIPQTRLFANLASAV